MTDCTSYAGMWNVFKLRNNGPRNSPAVLSSFTWVTLTLKLSFPGSSVSKESVWNAGDLSSIPGSGRSAGEGIGYPLQYSCASLVAQMVKKPPALQDTWVRSLGWKDPLEKGMATCSNTLPREFHEQRSLAGYSPQHRRVRYNWVTYFL